MTDENVDKKDEEQEPEQAPADNFKEWFRKLPYKAIDTTDKDFDIVGVLQEAFAAGSKAKLQADDEARAEAERNAAEGEAEAEAQAKAQADIEDQAIEEQAGDEGDGPVERAG